MADSIVRQAVRNAEKSGASVGDEILKIQNEMRVREDVRKSKEEPARKAAEKAAQTTTSPEGVKKTTYPYVAPSRGAGGGGRGGAMTGGGGGLPGLEGAMRKGGKVKGYASGGSVTRADGCVTKGHTKGKMR
jgi:hypothetical protein